MKKIILSGLMLAFFSISVFANITANNEYLLNHDGAVGQKTQLGTLIKGTKNLLVARYSYAVQGGSTTADIVLLTNLADKKSYATLPANAIITNAWIDVTSPVNSIASNTTKAIKVVSAGDILASGGTTGTAGFNFVHLVQGVPAGTTATFIKVGASSKQVKLTLGPVTSYYTISSGKFNVYIEYVLGGTTN